MNVKQLFEVSKHTYNVKLKIWERFFKRTIHHFTQVFRLSVLRLSVNHTEENIIFLLWNLVLWSCFWNLTKNKRAHLFLISGKRWVFNFSSRCNFVYLRSSVNLFCGRRDFNFFCIPLDNTRASNDRRKSSFEKIVKIIVFMEKSGIFMPTLRPRWRCSWTLDQSWRLKKGWIYWNSKTDD